MSHQNGQSRGTHENSGAPVTPTKQAGLRPSIDHDKTPQKDTPFVMKIDSFQETKLDRSQVSTGIRVQADRGKLLCTIPDLDTLCLGAPHTELVRGCFEHLLGAGVIQHLKDDVYDYPALSKKGILEADMYAPIIKMFNMIGTYFEGSYEPEDEPTKQATPTRYTWTKTSTATGLTTSRLKRYPDISMIPNTNEGKKPNISDVLVALEIKRNTNGDATEQVLDQYRAISSVQVNRRFTYSLSLRYPQFALWRLDRSGMIQSRIINIAISPKELIHIVGSLMSLGYVELGYYARTWREGSSPGGLCLRFQGTLPIPPPKADKGDESPTVASASEGLPLPPDAPGPDEEAALDLEVESTFKEPRGWLGRCTWVAKVKDPLTGRCYAFKISWQDPKRTSEGEFYVAARKAGVVIGLAEIVGYQELPLISEARFGLGVTEFEDRKQCRLLLGTVGELLEKCTSIVQLLEAVRDALICHRDLVHRAGLLHRDVSYNNVLLVNDVNAQAKIGKGILIDLEYAKKIRREQDKVSGRHSRTGTLAFMATALLDETTPVHEVHHDLESFLWVLLYTCSDSPLWINTKPLNKDTTPTYLLNRLFLQDIESDSLAHKKTWMTSTSTIMLSSRFRLLVPFFKQLRDLFASDHPRWPVLVAGAPLPTHDSVLEILQHALDDEGIRDAGTFTSDDMPVPVVVPTLSKQAKLISGSGAGSMQSRGSSSRKRGSDSVQPNGQEERPSNRRKTESTEGNPGAFGSLER